MEIQHPNGGKVYQSVALNSTEKRVNSDQSLVDLEPGHELVADKMYTEPEIQKEVDSLNKWLESNNSHLKFIFHEKLNEYYVQVVNDHTSEVIREIPSKKIMDISANIQEMIGLLIDEKR